MKRVLTATAALALTAGAAAADYNLTILHTNDFHDRFEPINGFDSTCDAEQLAADECFGGLARLATAIQAARAEAENPILLDAGDQYQGSLLYTLYKGEMSVEFMPQLGYDAMAVGNHEFDDGPAALATLLDGVEFPVLSANLDVTQAEELDGKIDKSTIIDVGGEQIGIVGVLAEDTPETSSPGPTVVFSPIVAAAQAEIDALTEQGIDKIIVLSHVGLPADRRLAEGLTGADVIVGGHSHTLLGDMEGAEDTYPVVVNDVPIVQAYAYGKYLGRLVVTFDDDGNVLSTEGAPILLDGSVEEDADITARVAELAEPLEEIRNMVVAETAAPIGGGRDVCRAEVCEMGVLIADAMLDRVKDQGIDVAIQNGGGIRASIDAGEVTMGEVLTVLPFQNTLATFSVDGATLLAALENGVSQLEEGAGRFPQVAGMAYTFDPSAEPGNRISDVTIAGAPLDMETVYGVVSNNYVRNGGDGYAMFQDAADAYDFGPDLADVTAQFLQEKGPYVPFVDDRINVK